MILITNRAQLSYLKLSYFFVRLDIDIFQDK